MSEHSDRMNALIRGRDPREPDGEEAEPVLPNFDGGARTPPPEPPPSMTRILRAALGVGDPDAAAERWVAEHR
jgi:hypothetical protein